MAQFENFDLGRVLQTAEAIKSMRNDSITQKLQQRYMGNQNAALEQNMQRQTQMDSMNFGAEKAKQTHTKAQYVLQSNAPKQLIEQQFPEFIKDAQASGIQWETLTDDQVKQMAQAVAAKAGAEAGIAPPAQLETMQTDGGGILQRDPTTGALKQVMAPQRPDNTAMLEAGRERRHQESLAARQQSSQPVFRALSPEEVQAAGLPPGTSAQMDQQSGKIDVLSKRDASSTLSQKDATTAKQKLNTIKLARQQLTNIRKRFKPLQGSLSAGPMGQGRIPSESGQSFDRAVDQMRSTLTALTRVPGVGAMSDYETKLDQAKFPTRQEYESVTKQQIDDLDNMLNLIEGGYSDLLGGSGESANRGASGSWGAKGTVTKHASGATIEILD